MRFNGRLQDSVVCVDLQPIAFGQRDVFEYLQPVDQAGQLAHLRAGRGPQLRRVQFAKQRQRSRVSTVGLIAQQSCAPHQRTAAARRLCAVASKHNPNPINSQVDGSGTGAANDSKPASV